MTSRHTVSTAHCDCDRSSDWKCKNSTNDFRCGCACHCGNDNAGSTPAPAFAEQGDAAGSGTEGLTVPSSAFSSDEQESGK